MHYKRGKIKKYSYCVPRVFLAGYVKGGVLYFTFDAYQKHTPISFLTENTHLTQHQALSNNVQT